MLPTPVSTEEDDVLDGPQDDDVEEGAISFDLVEEKEEEDEEASMLLSNEPGDDVRPPTEGTLVEFNDDDEEEESDEESVDDTMPLDIDEFQDDDIEASEQIEAIEESQLLESEDLPGDPVQTLEVSSGEVEDSEWNEPEDSDVAAVMSADDLQEDVQLEAEPVVMDEVEELQLQEETGEDSLSPINELQDDVEPMMEPLVSEAFGASESNGVGTMFANGLLEQDFPTMKSPQPEFGEELKAFEIVGNEPVPMPLIGSELEEVPEPLPISTMTAPPLARVDPFPSSLPEVTQESVTVATKQLVVEEVVRPPQPKITITKSVPSPIELARPKELKTRKQPARGLKWRTLVFWSQANLYDLTFDR